MGVYIKGLEMPEKCINCKFCVNMNEYPFHACFITYSGIYFDIDRLKNCPLVEIKTPHGRLIDADALFEAMGLDTVKEVMLQNWKCTTAWGVPIIEAEKK